MLFWEASCLTVSVVAVPKLLPALTPPRTVASAAGARVVVNVEAVGATCNSSNAQSMPASPWTATLNCPPLSKPAKRREGEAIGHAAEIKHVAGGGSSGAQCQG